MITSLSSGESLAECKTLQRNDLQNQINVSKVSFSLICFVTNAAYKEPSHRSTKRNGMKWLPLKTRLSVFSLKCMKREGDENYKRIKFRFSFEGQQFYSYDI